MLVMSLDYEVGTTQSVWQCTGSLGFWGTLWGMSVIFIMNQICNKFVCTKAAVCLMWAYEYSAEICCGPSTGKNSKKGLRLRLADFTLT